ncbi:MAG TPA: hypothetical protein VFT72_13960 [Opitutaceae bacterium]|nr:hypothetical protein [Opitutaceae bacterium]
MNTISVKLDELRSELVDLAYALEREGRQDAADVALSVSARVGEVWHEAFGVPAAKEG